MLGYLRMVLMVSATGACAALAGLLGLADQGGRYSSAVITLWSNTLLALSSTRLNIERADSEPPTGSVVYVCSHESVLDIPALYQLLPASGRFLAKRELFDYPVFGWCLRLLGFVQIARTEKGAARKALDDAARVVLNNRPLAVFPEGTRSKNGELLPFKKGAFALAVDHGLTIIPVACIGGGAIIPPGRLHVTPGSMTLRVGKPIPPSHPAHEHRTKLMKHTRETMEELRAQGALETNGGGSPPSDAVRLGEDNSRVG